MARVLCKKGRWYHHGDVVARLTWKVEKYRMEWVWHVRDLHHVWQVKSFCKESKDWHSLNKCEVKVHRLNISQNMLVFFKQSHCLRVQSVVVWEQSNGMQLVSYTLSLEWDLVGMQGICFIYCSSHVRSNYKCNIVEWFTIAINFLRKSSCDFTLLDQRSSRHQSSHEHSHWSIKIFTS